MLVPEKQPRVGRKRLIAALLAALLAGLGALGVLPPELLPVALQAGE